MEEPENATQTRPEGRPGGKPDLSYLESALGYRMKRALVELYRGIYESFGDTNLTLVQFSVLTIAQDNPGIAQSALASALGVERPRLVPIIDSLERLGLAERRLNPQDRRGRMIYLTDKGRACTTKLKKAFDDNQSRIVEKMGKERFHRLMTDLTWIESNSNG